MSARPLRIRLQEAIAGLPWAYGTVRNRATHKDETKRLPFLNKVGGRWLVDCEEAIDWLRANGWVRCALRMQKVAATALAEAEGGVASR